MLPLSKKKGNKDLQEEQSSKKQGTIQEGSLNGEKEKVFEALSELSQAKETKKSSVEKKGPTKSKKSFFSFFFRGKNQKPEKKKATEQKTTTKSLKKRSLYLGTIFSAFIFLIIGAGIFLASQAIKKEEKPAQKVAPLPTVPFASSLSLKDKKNKKDVPQEIRKAEEEEIEKRKKKGEFFIAQFGPEKFKTEKKLTSEQTSLKQAKNTENSSLKKGLFPEKPFVLTEKKSLSENQPPVRIVFFPEQKKQNTPTLPPSTQATEILWQYFLNQQYPGGTFVALKTKEKAQQTTKQNIATRTTTISKKKITLASSELLPFRYEPYCFVRARITVEADTSARSYLIAKVTSDSCGVPSGTLLIGKASYWPERGRAKALFTKAKLPDGRVYALLGEGYMLDETPGIGSVLKKNTTLKKVTQSFIAGLSSFFGTLREDQQQAQCIYTDYGVVCTSKQAQDRLKEALKEGGSTFFKELDVTSFIPDRDIVLIEKNLPIKVLLLPETAK